MNGTEARLSRRKTLDAGGATIGAQGIFDISIIEQIPVETAIQDIVRSLKSVEMVERTAS